MQLARRRGVRAAKNDHMPRPCTPRAGAITDFFKTGGSRQRLPLRLSASVQLRGRCFIEGGEPFERRVSVDSLGQTT